MKILFFILSILITLNLSSDWNEMQKLLASDGSWDDKFGCSLSVSGNYALIGAYFDDDNGDNSGSAYIFHNEDSNWTEQQKLTASDGGALDQFGISVSIFDNFAIVGADKDDYVGSAYIYENNASMWVEQQKLTASDSSSGDLFGRSVFIFGNYTVIGAVEDEDNGDNSGSCYIYHYNESNWTEQQKLTASDGAAFDYFGRSVSIFDSYAVIGAHRNDENGTNSGAVYIFHNDGLSIEDEDIQYSIENLQLNNYPNPFHHETTIKFNIKKNETAVLSIYNIKGQEVISRQLAAGSNEFPWKAENYPSGIYLYVLQSNNSSRTRKMILLR